MRLCLLVLAVAPATSLAQDECGPACNGDMLRFCDGAQVVELDCRELGTRCTVISTEWGADCVLGEGAACDPGYAFDASRCDPTVDLAAPPRRLYCIDGVCTYAESTPGPPADEEPTPGTAIALDAGDTNPFGCSDCGNSGVAAVILPAWWLRRRLRPLSKR
jgi:hypothetical protein